MCGLDSHRTRRARKGNQMTSAIMSQVVWYPWHSSWVRQLEGARVRPRALHVQQCSDDNGHERVMAVTQRAVLCKL
jgi:hypothetical protein